MKLIYISDNGRQHKKITINSWQNLLLPVIILFLVVFTGVSAFANYKRISTPVYSMDANDIKVLSRLDDLLNKAAALNAQVDRLNSLGETIAEQSKIDIQSFMLKEAPALGGRPATPSNSELEILSEKDLVSSINRIEKRLAKQQTRLEYLHQRSANPVTTPLKTQARYTKPVKQGYISSFYGNRLDPINGHFRHHNGIDIAAKHGSKIHAIASGFVTFVGKKGAYGNVIEIHHSDSLKSRYAHLNETQVKKGSVVRKGSIIATMGKTGRATGPHLHLEVWQNKQAVNPEPYINSAL